MRRLNRGLLFGAFVLLLALGALSSLSVVSVRASFPTTTGTLAVPGLHQPVEVLRDAYGVPNIYADSTEDLFMAQGYVQAQDRFFEMDFRRHITSGRLSEWFGASQYSTDAFVRTLGWQQVAEREVGLLSSSSRRNLDAFTAGVNAYLNENGDDVDHLSLEYAVLGLTGLDYQPAAWTPADSLAWIEAMAWQLAGNSGQESEVARVTAAQGADRALELWPVADPEVSPAIVTTGSVHDGRFDPSAQDNARPAPGLGGSGVAKALPHSTDALAHTSRAMAALDDLLGTSGLGADIGSNSWVIAGSRTTTGKPILSNDPHLATSIPSAFTQIGLHCRTVSASCPYDVSGFAFSGVPGVVIGHNANIAWGLTNSYADVQDLYLERVRGDTVQVGKQWQSMQVRTETITIKGEDTPRTLKVRSTTHGPVVSDVDAGMAEAGKAAKASSTTTQYAVSLAWTALTPDRTLDALFALDRATDFTSFRAAAAMFGNPSQNLVYADVKGNIGYQLNGSIPVRGKGDGVLLNPGWDPAYDWKGTIPFAELPYLYNPPSGVIVTANQTVISAHYPYPINNGDQSYGWRSNEIAKRLTALGRVSPQDSTDLYYDTTMGVADDVVPQLLRIQVRDPWVAEGQRTLVGWDYRATSDSAAAAYFNVVLRELWSLTFRDDLAGDLWPTGGDRWEAVLAQLMRQPNSWWWDDHTTAKVESRDDILLAAMTQARKEITAQMSRDTDGWQWGKLHRVRLIHPSLGTSGIAPVEALFNRGNEPAGGTGGVVDALAWDATKGYRVVAGPTMRMMIDLSDLDRSKWVNQSGVSGHAFNAHYDDQFRLWATNRLWDFASSRERVDGAAVDRLTLRPA